MTMRFLAGLLLVLSLGAPALAQPVKTGHLTAELGAQAQGIAPGQTLHLVLSQKIRKNWHTYWRNAGDSGEPTRIAWTLPPGWTAGGIVWPAPRRLPVGPLVNYGYEDQVLLPVPLTAAASARVGDTVTLKASVDFLVCEEICVPEHADLQISLPVVARPAAPDRRWAGPIAEVLAAAPRPAGLSAVFAHRGQALALAVTGPILAGADVSEAYFFPSDGGAIEHAKPQPIERGPQGLTLTLTPASGFGRPPGPTTLEGVLSLGSTAYEISAAPGALPPAAAGLGPPAPRSASGAAGLSLPLAAVFAFLGGLVLNLMPCVFPVLAMKAAALAGHGDERVAARRQALVFAAGVVVTFLLLAGALIGLRAAGAAVGWGFQLQSPPVVAGLALLLLAIALNLSGLFEVGGSLQNAGAGLAGRRGLAGSFFTGALAVVVAAPCTAPLMAPALGWALVQPAPAALAVFLALALGFAAPFTALAFIPGLISRLPKPGPWMDGLKKALAFPMYGAAAWLVWVLTLQAGSDGLARILACGVGLSAALWLAGIAQRRAIAGRRIAAPALGALTLGLAALAAALGPAYPEAQGDASPATADLASEPYSPARLAALRAEGRPVFVNYTAAWCVSCQVNDRLAISTPRAARAFADNKVAYLKADWTRKDPAIAADLARHGRAGVPLYLVYGVGGRDAVILPPILTEGLVVRALEAAARR